MSEHLSSTHPSNIKTPTKQNADLSTLLAVIIKPSSEFFWKKKKKKKSSEPSNLSLSTYTSLHQASSSISHHLDDSKHNPAEEKYNKEPAYRFPDRYETDVDVDVDTSISAPVYK